MVETSEASRVPRVFLYGALAVLIAAIAFGIWRNFSLASSQSGASDPSATAANGTGGASAVLASLEARTQKDPKDVEGWQLLGWSYFEAGRYPDAAKAYTKATQLAPERGVYWSSLGEALVMASERDPMPQEAAAAFDKAIALEPGDPRARYFIAVRKDLAGNHEGALADWLALLKDTPKDAPWESDLIRTIQQIGQINKIDITARMKAANAGRLATINLPADVASAAPNSTAAAAIPGPTRGDMAQAAKLPPGQQQQMVIAMVESLEGKLAKDPKNINGWIMLMRSRVTLGESAKAATALEKAVAANPGMKDRLMAEAQILGVQLR